MTSDFVQIVGEIPESKTKKKKPVKKTEVTLKDIFMGGTLNGFIEATRTKSLNEFVENEKNE